MLQLVLRKLGMMAKVKINYLILMLMTKIYNPVVVHYIANSHPVTSNCVYKDSYSYIEDNQDVAWFYNKEYQELFGIKRSLDHRNKLLAIVRLEYNGKVIRRRYKYDSSLRIKGNQVGLTSESIRILFDDMDNVYQEEILVSKGNFIDTIMFYWNHPFHATRISFKVGLPSLVISVVSLLLSILC